jgi:ABC-type polysaccharide/polyol phosphate export permease
VSEAQRAAAASPTSTAGDGPVAGLRPAEEAIPGGAQRPRLGTRQAHLHTVTIAWQLARLDLLRRYTRTMLGVVWAIVSPLCMAAIIGTVFGKLFGQKLETFLPYLFLNLTIWAFFLNCLEGGAISFVAAEGYIKQIPRVPLVAYPLRMVFAAFVTMLLGLIAVVVVMLVVGRWPTWSWALIAPALAAWFVFGVSIACLSGVFNAAVRDLQYIQTVAAQALFYATPIMFPASLLVAHGLQPLLTFNPMYHLMMIVQVPLLYGEAPPPAHYVAVCLTLVLVSGCAAAALRFARRRLVFWL